MKKSAKIRKRATFLAAFALMLLLIAALPTVAYASDDVTPNDPHAKETDTAIISMRGGEYSVRTNDSVLKGASLSQLISATERDGMELVFDNVTSYENLNICKNVTLSGNLTSYGTVTLSSNRAVLSEITLTIKSGNLRIKEGSSELISGDIILIGDSCVMLDFSASASFFVSGGSIKKSASGAAIVSKIGTVVLSGGCVENAYGAAIENHASLYLSGASWISGFSHGIFTSRPIHLSYRGLPFVGEATVMYGAEFQKGSFTKVLLDAKDSESADNIKLLDISGAEAPLTFFDESTYSDEKNIFAVYLPFRANFYVGSELFSTDYFLLGQAPSRPAEPELFGYDFGGWCIGGAGKETFDFLPGCSTDLSLYAAFSLSAPEFSLSSKSTVYNAAEQKFGFTSVFHPLSDSGSFSYVWYKNSELISDSREALMLSEVRDSGSYFCKLTFAYMGDYVTVTTPTVEFEILPLVLSVPEIPLSVYNGSLQYPSLDSTPLYKVDQFGALNVGSYPVELTLTDSSNYVWESGGSTACTDFVIIPAQNSFLSAPSVKDVFFGTAPEPTCAARFGDAVYYYSSDGKSYNTDVPRAVGEYKLIVKIEGTENYTPLASDPISFKIISEIAVGLKIDTMPERRDYSAFDTIDLSGIELTVTYNSGRSERISAFDITVSYSRGNSLLASDSCVMLEYCGVSVPLPLTVSAANYDISGINFSDTVCVFDGHRHTVSPIGQIIGLDGIPLEYEVRGGGINAGAYTVTLTFICRSPNYERPSDITATLTVLPREVTVIYTNTEFVYDGSMKLPSGSYTSAEGAVVDITLAGGGVTAGEYVATAELGNQNYIAKNPTVSFRINRALIDISKAKWNNNRLIYNGEEQSVYLAEIPHGLKVVGYTDASFTEVGSYRAVAAVSYDEENYILEEPLSFEWEILPAEYDMSGFSFADTEYVYDGYIHYPKEISNIPVGKDGSHPIYTFNKGACHVSDGKVLVCISFKSESKNYNAPPDMYAYVTVVPKSVEVVWGELTFVYDGSHHTPKAFCDECQISVIGGGTDAGSYTVTAVAESSDYTVSNAKVAFSVTKAKNSWLIPPTVLGIYEGGTLSPHAESRFGEVKFIYFSHPSLNEEIQIPTESGIYYMVAYVPEGKNHYELRSEAYEFRIVKVVPKELHVKLKSDKLYAKEGVSPDDFCAYLINNDGSITELISDSVTVEYKNGEYLCASDTYVIFHFNGLSDKLPIRVMRANYDMSAVRWENNFHIYNGEEKCASLVGLPEGITLIRYIKNRATEAGSYKLSALLEYDTENYNEPQIPEAWLVIKPISVTIPAIEDLTYTGKAQMPRVEENPIYTASVERGVNVGEYTVVFTLSDDKNYAFADGKNTASYKILPIKLHLRPNPIGRGYTVLSGEIINGDILGEEYYTEGGAVMMRIANQNYEITVEYVKSRSLALFLMILLLFILVGLGIYIFIRYRERIMLLIGIRQSTADTQKEEKCISEAKSAAGKDAESACLNTLLYVDQAHADNLISDDMAKSLLTDVKEKVITNGHKRCIVNLDTVCECFSSGETVDINAMKDKGIIPRDAGTVKVLGRGVMDKPLTIIANAFSLSAVKMIALTGGTAKRARR